MATQEQVWEAVERLAARIEAAGAPADAIPERTLVCVISDLGTAIGGRFKGSRLVELAETSDPTADVRITARSDDLVALIDGRLSVGYAFLTGKVRIEAATADLMLIRKLF